MKSLKARLLTAVVGISIIFSFAVFGRNTAARNRLCGSCGYGVYDRRILTR